MGQADPVASAACRFLDKLMPVLEENCPGPDDKALPFGPVRWVPDQETGPFLGRYKAVEHLITIEQQCAIRMLGELRANGMSELDEVERALAADSIIGSRLDQEVSSSAAGGQTWQGSSLVQVLVDRVIDRAGGFKLDPP
jgi:hypothetical protein